MNGLYNGIGQFLGLAFVVTVTCILALSARIAFMFLLDILKSRGGRRRG